MLLVREVYRVTRNFPNEEMFGLTSQLRRAAVSLPSNIAEGFGRRQTGDYVRFLNITYGSLCELDTQLEISVNLNYLPNAEFEILHIQVRELERMLASLIHKLKN